MSTKANRMSISNRDKGWRVSEENEHMETTNHVEKHSLLSIGCLFAAIALVMLIASATVAYICWNKHWYEEDNVRRREPMENIVHFQHKLKAYLSTHEGRYPEKQGVAGLAELVVLLSDLRVKDDEHVGTDPDYLSEQITSYAYVASGLSEKEMDGDMPVIFEKPWHRKSIRVLLSNGHVDVIETAGLKNCRQVVGYYKGRSKTTSAAWETLLRNADVIDHKSFSF